MFKTNIKKALGVLALTTIIVTNLANAYSDIQIGTGSVNGDNSFDTAVMWDESYPGIASGSVSGVLVTAVVEPTLNMELSTGSINLGTLVAGVTASGSIGIEVGTNAANGLTITASSGSGGLTNTSDNSIKINNMGLDGNAESYTFESSANADDSTVSGYNSTGDLVAIQVNDSYNHEIYETNKPELNDGTVEDVTFKVSTLINAQTAAGNYEDTITFTVTGNF